MKDMSFLTKLGEENENTPSGSTINGMSAEEYANMLDQKAEQGIEEPFYPKSRQPAEVKEDGFTPETLIEDMAPPPAPPPIEEPDDGKKSRKKKKKQEEGAVPKRYSENSYGNSAFMSAGADDRTLKERRMAAAKESAESAGAGFIGAVLGALLGIAVWGATAWFGYLTWAGGILLVFSVYLIYLLFARDIGFDGVIIVCIMMIAAIYVGNRLCVAVSINHEFIEPAKGAVSLTLKERLLSVKDVFLHIGDHLDKYGMKNKYGNNMLFAYFSAAITAGIVFIKRFG